MRYPDIREYITFLFSMLDEFSATQEKVSKNQFGISRVRARGHWGLMTRMSNKFGASLLGVFLNYCLGQPLMKLKDLLIA